MKLQTVGDTLVKSKTEDTECVTVEISTTILETASVQTEHLPAKNSERTEEQRPEHLRQIYSLLIILIWATVLIICALCSPGVYEYLTGSKVAVYVACVLAGLSYGFIGVYEPRYPWNKIAISACFIITSNMSIVTIKLFCGSTINIAIIVSGCALVIDLLAFYIAYSKKDFNVTIPRVATYGIPLLSLLIVLWILRGIQVIPLISLTFTILIFLSMTHEMYNERYGPMKKQRSPMSHALTLYLYVLVTHYSVLLLPYYLECINKI
ncbi:membrane protein S21 [Saimiriine betaherpesvirus 4]|uniref:Membrane protein S21 n=1 Tax=Saimiriine betaherpesvirus 4 TaxID=1535247 RepID=G8XT47_9BETA|nr:membrane protein S21 [Saimiriine betaherpesvirus 4]AEV80996.1 membrane protein S21 [Saimiriine betaherpesvirus 4]